MKRETGRRKPGGSDPDSRRRFFWGVCPIDVSQVPLLLFLFSRTSGSRQSEVVMERRKEPNVPLALEVADKEPGMSLAALII